ncbi:hypothetical protein QYE76_021950 [Lolium multiflorum]|uniref:CCHC-type domain-containing protein n=1 Tax=Lolium multiflorum TaxID=4521 RepID=A0AAD8R7G3_LOLMU|nr:hypothetical protein QYE76_021946 [Lolium multiflorum]KAK1616433.1 hypothetical protein QYE76_021950 [Lolium multiflorum]
MSRPVIRTGVEETQTGGHHHNNNNFVHHNNNFNRAPQEPPTPTPTRSKDWEQHCPCRPKDKSTINCYECGVVGHYSKECPQRLAKMAANTTGPAQQQRRVANNKKFAPNNPNNRSGRLFHMSAEEAREAPDVVRNSRTTTLPSRLQMAPFEATEGSADLRIGRKSESQVFGPDILREAEEKVHKIREYLKTAQSRQKSYADKRRREMTFEIGDFVKLEAEVRRSPRTPASIGASPSHHRTGSLLADDRFSAHLPSPATAWYALRPPTP